MVPYIEWRRNISNITPQDCRLGEDLLLIENKHAQNINSEPFMADVMSAIIITAGWSDMHISMKYYHICAPAIVIVMKDTIVTSDRQSEDIESFAVVMSDKFLSQVSLETPSQMKLVTGILQNPVIPLTDMEPWLLYKTMLKKIISSNSCMFKMETAMHLTLTIFYGYMIQKHQDETPKMKSRDDEITSAFLQIVHNEYRNHREVIWYADKMCITPKYLSMCVKKSSGRTPLDWIEECCVTEAKAMLSSTNMSIDEISVKLNFSSQSLFGKFFKRVTGMSPRDYKKRLYLFKESGAQR